MNVLALMLTFAACELTPAQVPIPEVPSTPARPDMVLKWNEVALQAIRHDKTPPPIAARNLAIVHLSIYDAVMAIERTHQPYNLDVTPLEASMPEAAVAAAAHHALVALYPKQREGLDKAIALCWSELPKNAEREAGGELGRFIAKRMLASRCDDGADEAAGKYLHKMAPGLWRPTAPRFQDALLPEWGYVKPFAIKKGTQYRPQAPPPLDSVAYAASFNEVRRLGGRDSKFRTKEQTEIALFWADDAGTVTPPGHWNRIAQTIAQEKGATLAQNARLFAQLNMALSDAGVLCWVIKFTFDFWRPITAIREADRDEWTPLLNTPPFPAYISGHSTFSSAAAAVLIESFGSDKIAFATGSDDLPDVTRKFSSIWSAAEEAGMSRIYGGIHWQFDNTEGLKVGRTLGEYVTRNTLPSRERRVERKALYPELPPIIKGDK